MARSTRILSTALITAAVVLLLDVGLTLTYREPVSWLYGSIQQSAAKAELAEVEAGFPGPDDLAAAERSTGPPGVRTAARIARVLADRFEPHLEEGRPIATIVAAEIDDLETVVLEGISTSTLRSGPGHYPATALPGQPGTVAVAGHRTTYQAPFRGVAEVDRGDAITMQMPYGSFEYTVTRTEIVTPDRVDVTDDVGYPQLVLTACHPLYSAAERIVVFARLTSIDLDWARLSPG